MANSIKIILCSLVLASFYSVSYADPLTPDQVKMLHNSVTKSFLTFCKAQKKPEASCNCLMQIVDRSLDDSIIKNCDLKANGKQCMLKFIHDGNAMALTKANIDMCSKNPAAAEAPKGFWHRIWDKIKSFF